MNFLFLKVNESAHGPCPKSGPVLHSREIFQSKKAAILRGINLGDQRS